MSSAATNEQQQQKSKPLNFEIKPIMSKAGVTEFIYGDMTLSLKLKHLTMTNNSQSLLPSNLQSHLTKIEKV